MHAVRSAITATAELLVVFFPDVTAGLISRQGCCIVCADGATVCEPGYELHGSKCVGQFLVFTARQRSLA